MKRARYLGPLLVTVALLATTACSPSTPGASSNQQDMVTIAMPSEPNSLDPQRLEQEEVFQIGLAIYDRLMRRDGEGVLVPDLAAAEPELINETTWRFTLRPDVTFTNGDPVNAEAVKFSVDRVLDPALNSQWASTLAGITEAKVVDDLTVDIVSSGPNPIVPAQMVYVAIMSPSATTNDDVGDKLIGSGPYQLASWDVGQKVSLEANPDYWGDAPAVSKVDYVFPPDAGTRLSGLISGEYDLISDVAPEDAERAPQTVVAPSSELRLTRLSATVGLTQDVRVRQAMNYAIDTQAIIDNVFGGQGQPAACQALLPQWFGYNESLQPYPYDPEKAKALLEEAGAMGQKVTLMGTSGRFFRDRELNQAIVEYWKAAGLDANVKFLSDAQFLETIFDPQQAPAGGISTDHNNALFDASRTAGYWYDPASDLAANDEPGLGDLVKQAASQTDETKRQELYNQITQIGCDQALFWFGISAETIYGMSDRINFTPRRDGLITPATITLK